VSETRVGARSSESFGPFEIFERLGTGGMAVVHRAIRKLDDGGEREVALKRLLPHLAEDASFIRAFAREAKMAQRLHHPNICEIYELGRVGDHYFISMQYLDGCDLRALLRRAHARSAPASMPLVVSVLAQLCAALDHAHTATDEETGEPLGLVHRDVSPANILVTRAGQVKIIDFGIAKATLAKFRTETGRFRGKLGYLSPEAIQGQTIDRRSDLFSLGVIAYELLTARPLFGAVSDFDTLSRVQFGQVDPPSVVNPMVPLELEAIVMTALAKDPGDRWQSAAAMRNALLEVAALCGGMVTDQVIGEWVTAGIGEAPATGPLDAGLHAAASTSDQVVELVWGSDRPQAEKAPVDVPDVSQQGRPRPVNATDKVVPLEAPDPQAGIRKLPRDQGHTAAGGIQPRGKRGNRDSGPPRGKPVPAPRAVPAPTDADPRFDTHEMDELTPADADNGDTVQMDALSREEIMEVGSAAALVDGVRDTVKVPTMRRDPADFETVQIDRLEQVSAATETVKAPALERPPLPPPAPPPPSSTGLVPRTDPAALAPTRWYRRWDVMQTAVAALLLLLAPAPVGAGDRSGSPADEKTSGQESSPASLAAPAPPHAPAVAASRPAPAAAPDQCHLVVTATPATGTVWLDDEVIGRTPLDLSISCRGGLLAVEREGFRTAIRTLSFADGRREAKIEVDLDRKPQPKSRPTKSTR
jgi:serine/threonine-protein kinase